MTRGPAHPGPNDGSGPLVWIIAGVCIAVLVLIMRLVLVPGARDQAIVYVLVGGAVGFLIHWLRRRSRSRKGQR